MTEEEYRLWLFEERQKSREWLRWTMQKARRRYWAADEDPIEREDRNRALYRDAAIRAAFYMGWQVQPPSSVAKIVSVL